ncbi:hypothetical protein BH11ARM2_BH11ARM2_26770 [soil metagenome]
MRRLLALFLLLTLAGAALAQDPAPTSRSDAAVKSVADRIRREVAERSGTPDDAEAAARNPLHLVFLLDTSQAGTKDDYGEFARKFIAGLLREFGGGQKRAGVSDDALDDVSFYPYQMDLITDDAHTLRTKRLKAGEGTVQAVQSLVPNVRIPIPGETDRGHDSTTARHTLLTQLGSSMGPRETVVVQITPQSQNADPDRPENDAKIKAIDARSGGLEDTDYVVYRDDGRYFQTDPPGKNVAPSDVYVWVYGPARFDVPPATPVAATPAAPKPVVPPPKPFPILLVALGIPVLLVLGYVGWRLTVKYPVKIAGEVARVGTSAPLAIKTAGSAKGDERALLVPRERQGTLGPGLKVGEVTVPFLFGGPRVFGSGGYTLKSGGATPSVPLPLSAKPTSVVFAKGEAATEPIQISS